MCCVILRWNPGKVTLPMRVALIHRYVSQKAVNAMKATKTTNNESYISRGYRLYVFALCLRLDSLFWIRSRYYLATE